MGYYRKPSQHFKYFCPICKKATKQTQSKLCCGEQNIRIHTSARVPKLTDNKKKWIEFLNRFFSRSTDERIIQLMRSFKMDCTLNLSLIEKRKEKPKDIKIQYVSGSSYDTIDSIAFAITAFHKNNTMLYSHQIKSNKFYYIIHKIYNYTYGIPAEWSDLFRVRKVKIISNGHGTGFYKNTETGKEFILLNQNDFVIFKEKQYADLYQLAVFSDLSVFPYKEKIQQELKKNRVRFTHPELLI